MPARKMRVEVFDETGNRYTISLEGRVTRENALRVLDMVELLGGMRGTGSDTQYTMSLSKFEKVRLVVEKNFPLVWFSAKDASSVYTKETNEKTSLSTISTYLTRLSKRGVLVKTKSSNRVLFKLAATGLQQVTTASGS